MKMQYEVSLNGHFVCEGVVGEGVGGGLGLGRGWAKYTVCDGTTAGYSRSGGQWSIFMVKY